MTNRRQTDAHHRCVVASASYLFYTFPKFVLANNSLPSELVKPAAVAKFAENGSKLNAVVADDVGDDDACDASARSRPPVVNIVAL